MKGELVTVHATITCRRSTGIAPLILYFSNRWALAVSFTPNEQKARWAPSRSGRFGQETNLQCRSVQQDRRSLHGLLRVPAVTAGRLTDRQTNYFSKLIILKQEPVRSVLSSLHSDTQTEISSVLSRKPRKKFLINCVGFIFVLLGFFNFNPYVLFFSSFK